MPFLITFKRFFRSVGFFFALTIAAGVLSTVLFVGVLPKLSAWSESSWIKWSGFSTSSPTIIQRTEQVVLSQEEGLERLVAAPRTAVVSILSVPSRRASRMFPNDVPAALSGVLVTNDGLVAAYANESPDTEGRRFTVFFSDGNASQAQFVSYDSVVNVAYFRTERSDTPAIAFANSTDVRPGRRFMALTGTSDPTEGKLASGYVGERARAFNLSGKTVSSTDEWEGVFLPDRPLGREYSGGVAVALNGELIGLIGSLTLDATEQTFILPANALRQSLQRVIAGESMVRPGVGAYYISLSPETALAMGTPRDQGAIIFTPSERPGLAIIVGGLAEKAGLRYGDIVTAVNGRAISLDWPLSVALYEAPDDSVIELTIFRNDAERMITLTR